MSCLLFTALVGVRPTAVAYRGSGPALNDLISEQFDLMCDQIPHTVPQVQAGTIKALAIATPQRSPALPDVPTTLEAGLPGFQASGWNAMFAPKGTPPAVVAKLSAALVGALDDEATRKRLLDLGATIPDRDGRSPEALQALVVSEVARWTPVLKAAGAVAN